MRVGKLLSAAIAVGLFASAASAALTATWVQNTISPAAITADATLANMQSWSLNVTYTDGDWASAGLRATLPAGNTFYNPALGGSTKPAGALIAAFPNLAFDTYVTGPADPGGGAPGAPSVLGGFPNDPASFGGSGDAIPGTVSASWGDLTSSAPGTYEIARLTFPSSVAPSAVVVEADSFTSQVNPDGIFNIPGLTGGGGTTPEPATLGLLAIGGLLGLRRRA
jgi:hypothetical protein